MKIEELLKRVMSMPGVEELNDMQREMSVDSNSRVMLTAPTGSGKTIAFAIRLLRSIDSNVVGLQGIVLAPTRELVLQIAGVIKQISGGVRTVAVYGGHDMRDEINELAVEPTLIVATPGRLVDHINRRTVDVSAARNLVLDEFDKCLQLGFQEDMGKIVRRLRKLKLVLLTSATSGTEWPDFVGEKSAYRRYDYEGGAGVVSVAPELVAVKSPSRDKLDTLVELLRSMDNGKVIVFVNHRESAERVFERLMREGVPSVLYHGALDQQQRRMAVERLANGSAPVMVSTDLASRGLDIPAIESVVHYHQPIDRETWTHRNGRTARQGARGTVYAIMSEGEKLPEGETADRELQDLTPSESPIEATMVTLYINAGKKEKISKGDVAGYVMQKGGLTREEVGRIMVDDHYSLVAVVATKARNVVSKLSPHKLKNTRVRVSVV